MKRMLKRKVGIYYWENNKKTIGKSKSIFGDVSGIFGNVSDIFGNVSGIFGDVSGIFGDVDDCEITTEERERGIKITELIKDEK